ncbi:hypothetical protein EJ110_NYTH39704 [Nymphaea thermarum]|nr:hypothetical protein EJ110_NYTH39704 [Nymphaea thermarum]
MEAGPSCSARQKAKFGVGDHHRRGVHRLDADALCKIFSLLDHNGLARCSAVCKSWHRTIQESSLWKDLFYKHYKKVKDGNSEGLVSCQGLPNMYFEELAMEQHRRIELLKKMSKNLEAIARQDKPMSYEDGYDLDRCRAVKFRHCSLSRSHCSSSHHCSSSRSDCSPDARARRQRRASLVSLDALFTRRIVHPTPVPDGLPTPLKFRRPSAALALRFPATQRRPSTSPGSGDLSPPGSDDLIPSVAAFVRRLRLCLRLSLRPSPVSLCDASASAFSCLSSLRLDGEPPPDARRSVPLRRLSP